MSDEIREIKVEQLDTMVTIPLSEYRNLVEQVAAATAKMEVEEANREMCKYRDRAWAAEDKVRKLQENLDDAKAQIADLLGIEEAHDA